MTVIHDSKIDLKGFSICGTKRCGSHARLQQHSSLNLGCKHEQKKCIQRTSCNAGMLATTQRTTDCNNNSKTKTSRNFMT